MQECDGKESTSKINSREPLVRGYRRGRPCQCLEANYGRHRGSTTQKRNRSNTRINLCDIEARILFTARSHVLERCPCQGEKPSENIVRGWQLKGAPCERRGKEAQVKVRLRKKTNRTKKEYVCCFGAEKWKTLPLIGEAVAHSFKGNSRKRRSLSIGSLCKKL